MPIKRPPPAPTIGRKPQTGLPPQKARRRGRVVGPLLSYLTFLHGQKSALAELVEQELALIKRIRRTGIPESIVPSPLAGSVRLRPGDDPLLRLDPDAIKQIDPSGPIVFDSTRPAVAVSLEFLGAARDLPPLGVIPALQAGDLFFGWVNLERVAALADHNAIVRIEALRTLAPTSIAASGDEVFDGGSPPAAIETGQGVRLAVIDLGFDFLHPGLLRDDGGVERVRALWLHDMVLSPEQAAPAGTLGRRFSARDLNCALEWYTGPPGVAAPSAVTEHLGRLVRGRSAEYKRMLQRHGTAVTGIAAGNGRGGGPYDTIPPVLGAAREADLLLIAIGAHDEMRFADSSEVAVAFGAAFADSSAPCVALMANSDTLGGHDGSLDGERFLDELLLLPGRAIVLTAGNLNHQSINDIEHPAFHAVTQAGHGNGTSPSPLVMRYSGGANAPDSAEVWFRPPAGTAATATITLRLRDGWSKSVLVAESPVWLPILEAAENPKRTEVSAQLQRDVEADAHCLRLVFRPARGLEIAESVWTIDVTAEGPVHGWLDRNNMKQKCWQGATAQAGADHTTLSSPASATRPLTVGSVASAAGTPSVFSGRGPLRAPPDAARKPDLVAIGENARGPLGDPYKRKSHAPSNEDYVPYTEVGTSYAAPHVAGACALLFERFGSAATWADIRQAILQATERRSSMPTPDADGWDPACGFGLLAIGALCSPPSPEGADLWLPKTSEDNGTEPFVDWTFWESPALLLIDSTGRKLDPNQVAIGEATPERILIRVENRGAQLARDVLLSAWWAPLGAVHPLPRPDTGGGSWNAAGFGIAGKAGNLQKVATISRGDTAEVVFDWTPPRNTDGGILPHLLLATASSAEDPYDPKDTACAQNNVAMLAIAAVSKGAAAEFQISGSEDTDGLILWCDNPKAHFRLGELPVTALPWRSAAMFQAANRRDRPLYGSPDMHDDMAVEISEQFETSKDVAEITEVMGADRLDLEYGQVTIDSSSRLTLPRLRIAHGVPLTIKATVFDDAAGAIHMLHLSGGRRVGGGTIRIVP